MTTPLKPYKSFEELAPEWYGIFKKAKLSENEADRLRYNYNTCAMAEVRKDDNDRYYMHCKTCELIADLFSEVYFGMRDRIPATIHKLSLEDVINADLSIQDIEQVALDHVNKEHLAARRAVK